MRRLSVKFQNDIYLASTENALIATLTKKGLDKNTATSHVKRNAKWVEPTVNGGVKYALPKKGKTLSEVLHGASAIVNVNSGNSVSQEEVMRRAIICSNCPQKTAISGCMGCGMGKKITNAVNSLKKALGFGYNIPNGLDKEYCSVCDCALSVMLPAKMSAFSEDDQSQRPDHCWVKKTSPNFVE